MSRTYRRKKDKWAIHRYVYVHVPGTYTFIKEYLSVDDERYKKNVIYFHKDTDKYFNTVPSAFVNLFCERKLRRQSKIEINKWIKNPELDCILPPYVKDAGRKYY